MQLGTEFMPNLNEGTLFYMPTTLPGLSVTKAAELLQTQDRIIKSFPEVASVFGKAGRAATATDPAPIEMFETVINLKPESEWRPGMTDRQADRRDGPGAAVPRRLATPGPCRSRRASTCSRPASARRSASRCSAPTSPRWRGSRAQIEAVLRTVPGTTSAYAERVIGGYYLDIEPDRAQLARYGLMIGDVQDVIATALGGETVTTTVEGRERYARQHPLSARLRSDPQAIATRGAGADCPTAARCRSARSPRSSLAQGPASIRTENAQLAVYIFVDIRDRDLGGYVADAQRAVAEQVKFPPGYYVTWSGQFEYLERAKARLQGRRAGHAADHLPAALPQFPAADRDADRHAVGAVRAGRRPVADVVARLQPVASRSRSASSRWPASPPRPAS